MQMLYLFNDTALWESEINKPKVVVQFVALFRLWQKLLDLPERRPERS